MWINKHLIFNFNFVSPYIPTNFDMIRKFPCYCNLCEHESRACAQSKEAPMEKTWQKTDFDIIWKFPCYYLLCEREFRACAESKEHQWRKNGTKWILTLFESSHVNAICVKINPEPVLRLKSTTNQLKIMQKDNF